MEFGERLRECRKTRNLLQREMAEKLGISLSCYNGYENGYREPDLKTLVKICKILEVESDYILGLID